MSREIKFRAWDTHDEMMYEVSEMIFAHAGTDWKAKGDHAMESWRGDAEFMQYTGLKDKNGKDIYEGDLLGGIDVFGRVLWAHGDNEWLGQGAGWIVNTRGDCESWVELEAGLANDCEVIGNIWENPELLNGEPS